MTAKFSPAPSISSVIDSTPSTENVTISAPLSSCEPEPVLERKSAPILDVQRLSDEFLLDDIDDTPTEPVLIAKANDGKEMSEESEDKMELDESTELEAEKLTQKPLLHHFHFERAKYLSDTQFKSTGTVARRKIAGITRGSY